MVMDETKPQGKVGNGVLRTSADAPIHYMQIHINKLQ